MISSFLFVVCFHLLKLSVYFLLLVSKGIDVTAVNILFLLMFKYFILLVLEGIDFTTGNLLLFSGGSSKCR